MRAASVSIFFLVFFHAQSETFTVFEKDGFFGVKDLNGEVAVPAVYEKLGWSNNSQAIENGLIGFQSQNSWGLLSVKNKVLTEAKYYSLEPFGDGLIKGSIKGKFSNQLFYGLLNASGKTLVGFHYFSLERIGKNLLVSHYEKNQQFGILTFSDKLIVPSRYQSIENDKNVYYANRFDGGLDLFDLSGALIAEELDSIHVADQAYLGYKDGYVGLVNQAGNLEYDFSYKAFDVRDNQPISFARWSVFKGRESQFEVDADSLEYQGEGLWKMYLNGTQHLKIEDSMVSILRGYAFIERTEKNYLLKDWKTAKWSVANFQNEEILDGYDSVFATNYGIWAKRNSGWTLFNRYGKKKNRFQYAEISKGIENQFAVKLNGYWGILDPLGNQVTPFKFDKIERSGESYIVKYLGHYGAIDKEGVWLVRAEYSDVKTYGPLIVGKKGYSFSYYDSGGLLRKSVLKPKKMIGEAVMVEEDSLLGLLNLKAQVLTEPAYDDIAWCNGYYELSKNGIKEVMDLKGKQVYNTSARIQDLAGYSEQFYLVKKKNRWGFLDFNGRLRISNRYDSAQLFSEGLAAVMLNGKWGFIDKSETLVIQPYYQEVGAFKNGVCVVKAANLYGMVDVNGKEVVDVSWDSISRLETDNYLLKHVDGKLGLIASSGKILLRPAYDAVQDLGDRVVVMSNGKKGILSYSGDQLFKPRYKEIKISGEYTILKH